MLTIAPPTACTVCEREMNKARQANKIYEYKGKEGMHKGKEHYGKSRGKINKKKLNEKQEMSKRCKYKYRGCQ